MRLALLSYWPTIKLFFDMGIKVTGKEGCVTRMENTKRREENDEEEHNDSDEQKLDEE